MASERRSNHPLRVAVDRLRVNLYEITSEEEVVSRLLYELCDFLECDSAVYLKSEHGTGSAVISPKYEWQHRVDHPDLVSLEENSSHPINLYKLPKLYYHDKPRTLGDAALKTLLETRNSGNHYKNVATFPLGDIQGVIAVICLCNGTSIERLELLEQCRPLVATALVMIRMLQHKQQLSNEGIDALRSDNSSLQEWGLVEQMSPLAMLMLDNDLKIKKLNPSARKLFAVKNIDEVMDEHIRRLLPESFNNEHKTQTFLHRSIDGQKKQNIVVKGLGENKASIQLILNFVRVRKGLENAYVVMLSDSTEINELKSRISAETQRFRALSDLSPVGILHVNEQWDIIYSNHRWSEICGVEANLAVGKNWLSIFHPEDAENAITQLHESMEREIECEVESRFVNVKGQEIWAELHARPIFNSKGVRDGFILTLIDTQEQHENETRLRQLAERDALTSLANRTLLVDRLNHALARVERHGPMALLCLDLDGFKNVNDSLGHDAGDALLIEVANRLSQCVREEDTVARVGGDEFMIVLEGIQDARMASNVAEKILLAFDTPIHIQLQDVFTSASIGIAFAVQKGVDTSTIMKQADIALYRAKAAGKKNYQYYSPELEKASKDRLELGNSLHQALQLGQFEVYYQLQASVRNGGVTGAEALLRWQHPTRGLMPPGEFLDILDESGLIVPVSRWIWHRAFADFSRWLADGLMPADAHISVNLSPRQVRDRDFILGITNAMKDHNIKGQNIVIEITETALFEDSLLTSQTLEKINDLGIRIALDDFGTGFSSLTYLKKYPIDQIKIDQSFVRDITTDNDDKIITQAVIALAKSLDKHLVAEGVEDIETLNYLRELNCDTYQGYLLNKPLGASDLEALLKQLMPSSHVSSG